ncbi:Uncharacterised protein [uncultured archaeon]|nr:Uncharacterised protein [uncultured archaeon]
MLPYTGKCWGVADAREEGELERLTNNLRPQEKEAHSLLIGAMNQYIRTTGTQYTRTIDEVVEEGESSG